MNFLLIDFEDSFTLNIASYLKIIFPDSKISIFKWFEAKRIEKINSSVIILGPGPGKPQDYKLIYPFVKKILKDKKKYLYGICLGHQLLGELFGFKLKKSLKPIHGLKKTYSLDLNWRQFLDTPNPDITVQHYNSLCLNDDQSIQIKKYVFDNEVLMLRGEKFFSCQFHPESIATKNPELFFKFLKEI